MIHEGYRQVKNKEKMRDDDLAFGCLEGGGTGWGKIPSWLVGQVYCEGASGIGHPRLLIRKQPYRRERG